LIEFSCADFTFPLLSRSKSLKLLRLLGFSRVDIGLFARSTHFHPAELCSSPLVYTAAATEDLKREELRAADVFLQIGTDPAESSANDPSNSARLKNREIFRRAVDFCVALGCSHLTGLPGVFHASANAQQNWALAVEEAAWRTMTCSAAGLAYAIEPHLGSICDSVESTLRFLAAVPGLTLTLDYGHFVYHGTPTEAVHALVPSTSHLHARAGARGRLQVACRENQIDFAGALRALKQAHYSGTIALEYVWVNWNQCNQTDNISETILLWKDLTDLIAANEAQTRYPFPSTEGDIE